MPDFPVCLVLSDLPEVEVTNKLFPKENIEVTEGQGQSQGAIWKVKNKYYSAKVDLRCKKVRQDMTENF